MRNTLDAATTVGWCGITRLRVACAIAIASLALVGALGCSRAAVTPSSVTGAGGQPALSHPPYQSGSGRLSGTVLRTTTATYPVGSTGQLIPFKALVVRWDQGGSPRLSEFLINGEAGLIFNGKSERHASAERIVSVLASAGPGAKVDLRYVGSHLLPIVYPTPPPADFPYALVATITVDISR